MVKLVETSEQDNTIPDDALEKVTNQQRSTHRYSLSQVEDEFWEAVKSLALTPEQIKAIVLRKTPQGKNGDYGFPCFALAKELRKSPQLIAEEIAARLNHLHTPRGYIASYEAMNGYVNLHLDYTKYTQAVIDQSIELGPLYGSENIGQGRHVIIDFSSPNIAKRMSIGHLRSTIIGDALSRIHQFLGYKVTRDNHIGDWGTGFGHIIHAIKTWGDMDKIAANPIEELQSLYVKVTAAGETDPDTVEAGRNWFLRLEQGDAEARDLWQKIVTWSLADFQKVYDVLGIEFDEVLGESFYENQLEPTVDKMRELGITSVSDGALIVDLKPGEESGKVVVQKTDGASLYVTRDIATAVYRAQQMEAEEIIYVVGDEQRPYFEELFAILRLMELPVAEYAKHVYFGLIRLPDGKMSTRKGRVILLEELIREAFLRTTTIIEEKRLSEREEILRPISDVNREQLVKQVAVGAIKWSDLSHNPKTSVVFDMDKAVALDGNCAPYVQYTHARAQSILEKVDVAEINVLSGFNATHQLEKDLVNALADFPAAVQRARAEYDPSVIADAIYVLAQAFNSMYMKLPVLKAETIEERATRIGLTASVAQTIRNGLYLLGIEAPNRM